MTDHSKDPLEAHKESPRIDTDDFERIAAKPLSLAATMATTSCDDGSWRACVVSCDQFSADLFLFSLYPLGTPKTL